MATDLPLWYIDTNVYATIINRDAAIKGNGLPRWQSATEVLEKAERGEIVIATSTLTIVELNGGKRSQPDTISEKIDAFFDAPYLLPVSVNQEIATKAREIIWHIRRDAERLGTSTKEPEARDAIHLASAIVLGCDKLITWDEADLCPLSQRFGATRITTPAAFTFQPRLSE